MQPGEVIADRYQVDRVVRRGGLSTLLAAHDRRTGVPVAVKIVTLTANDQPLRERLRREVSILRRLNHPRIVRCLDAGALSVSRVYLVLEWLDGQDLAERMTRGLQSLRTTLEVVAQVSEALEVAHRQGIVHRDIKPANIFVVDEPNVDCRVLDFGVAKVVKSSDQLTQTGAILGTPNYMAPEQASYAMAVDGRADLYSLGVVAFELLTGRLPFTANTDLARLARILVEEATPVRLVLPDLPPAAAELIDGLLVREPDGRIATAEALQALVRGTLAALPAPALDQIYSPRPVDPEAATARAASALPTATVPLVSAVGSERDQRRSETPAKHPAIHPATGSGLDAATAVPGVRDMRAATDADWMASDPDWSADGGDHTEPAGLVLVESADAHFDFEPHGPLFGRQEALDGLVAGLQAAARSGQPRLFLVVGPGGIGKTRLRAAATVRLTEDDPRPPLLFADRTEERRRHVPFDFIRRLVFAHAGVTADDDPDHVERRIRMLLPSPDRVRRLFGAAQRAVSGARGDARTHFVRFDQVSSSKGPDAPDIDPQLVFALVAEALGLEHANDAVMASVGTDPVRTGTLMVQALYVLLRSRIEGRGMVVMVDDIEWLDYGSARVLRSLLGGDPALPFAVAGFALPMVLDPDARPDWPLADLSPVVVRLGPLPPAPCRSLAASLSPSSARDVAHDVERVIQRAAGNVLYLEQLILGLGEAARAEGGAARPNDEPLSPTLSAAISARIAVRGMPARRVITAAAVFGPVFWAEGVAELVRGSLEATMAELETLTLERWVRPRTSARYSGQTEYEFTHGALQAVALARLKRQRREVLEGQVVAYLMRVGERSPAVLADHQAASGQAAAQLFLAAAEQALEKGDFEAAARLAEDGLGLPDAEHSPLAAALMAVLENVALATSDWGLGTEALDRLAAYAPDATARSDLACRRCRLALQTHRLAEARAAVAQAVQLAAGGLSGPWMAQVQLFQAEVAERDGAFAEAQRLYAQAHNGLAGIPEWSTTMGRATMGLARLAVAAADYATAENRYWSALVQARSRHQRAYITEAQGGLVETARQQGDLKRARSMAAQLVRSDLSEARHARSWLVDGLLALEARRFAEAQVHLERATVEAATFDVQLWMRALIGLARLYRLPADSTPGVTRNRARWIQLKDDLQAASREARASMPQWLDALALAQATVAALLGTGDPSAVERMARGFESTRMLTGEEPPVVAHALAWLRERTTGTSSPDAWRVAAQHVDAVVERLPVDDRPRYLGRPLIAAVTARASELGVISGPQLGTHRLF